MRELTHTPRLVGARFEYHVICQTVRCYPYSPIIRKVKAFKSYADACDYVRLRTHAEEIEPAPNARALQRTWWIKQHTY